MPHIMRLGADDLLHCRFALSPLWETHQAVRTLDRPAKSLPYHLPWLRRSAEAARALDLLPLWLLMPEPGYTPDFVCPPPLGLDTTFEDEISAVRVTDPEVARYEIRRALTDGGALHTSTGQKLLADPARVVQDLAALLEQAWQALVAPHWPRLRTLLEADIAFHARRLAEGGLASLFADLHPEVSWSDGTLTVRRHRTHVRTLHGEGLLLMPSVFAWPEVISGFDPPWQPTLVYPARGIGGLWAVGGPQPSAALRRLLGAGRASVLAALAEPASTSALAARLGLTPSSVSAHLHALRDARLLTSRREKHKVLYERTPLGIALVEG
ncbi:DUF5937 family protein [Streptomyces sp. NPDC003631]